jgi:hypothetical protein
MKKSLVGDPIIWPGLIYSPINIHGLIYALGTVSDAVGLIFEEFHNNGISAVCRRKTDAGWERVNVAFYIKSSQFGISELDIDHVDFLICWKHDSKDSINIPLIILSEMMGSTNEYNVRQQVSTKVENIFPEDPASDLEVRAEARRSFEDAVQELDNRIKKLKGSQ